MEMDAENGKGRLSCLLRAGWLTNIVLRTCENWRGSVLCGHTAVCARESCIANRNMRMRASLKNQWRWVRFEFRACSHFVCRPSQFERPTQTAVPRNLSAIGCKRGHSAHELYHAHFLPSWNLIWSGTILWLSWAFRLVLKLFEDCFRQTVCEQRSLPLSEATHCR